MKKHLKLIAALAVVALVAVILMAYRMHSVHVGRPDAANIGTKGGLATSPDSRARVEVKPGAAQGDVKFTLSTSEFHQSPSPLDSMTQPIGSPVEIKVSEQVSADVVFKITQADIPQPEPGFKQATIDNAGIEVYNTDLGVWIPLDTTSDPQKGEVRAVAPHFSLYRVVVAKIGELTLNFGHDIKIVTDSSIKPIELFAKVVSGFTLDLFRNATGIFDEKKFVCEPKDLNLRTKVSDDLTDWFNACAVKDGGKSELAIKNGYSFPLSLKPSDGADVKPVLDLNDLSISGITSQLGSALTGKSSVSGLSVAHLSVGKNAPQSFAVNGEINWAAATFEVATFALMFFFPAEKAGEIGFKTTLTELRVQAAEIFKATGPMDAAKLQQIIDTLKSAKKIGQAAANQASAAINTINCALSTTKDLKVSSKDSAVSAIIGNAQQCLKTALSKVIEAGQMLKILGNILTETVKAVPETAQLAIILAEGKGGTRFRVDVQRVDPILDAYVGEWYSHGQSLKIGADYSGEMTSVIYGANGPHPADTPWPVFRAKVRLEIRDGKQVAVFTSVGDVPYFGDSIHSGDVRALSHQAESGTDDERVTIQDDIFFCSHAGCIPSTDSVLMPFVGTWRMHWFQLVINPDYTGSAWSRGNTNIDDGRGGLTGITNPIKLKLLNGQPTVVYDDPSKGSPFILIRHEGDGDVVYLESGFPLCGPNVVPANKCGE